MEKEFVPFEIAKKLDSLGFKKFFFKYYCLMPRYDGVHSLYDIPDNWYGGIGAPLYQQAFDWFKEKHNIHCYLYPKIKYPDNVVAKVEGITEGITADVEYYFTIITNNYFYEDDGVRTYEETRLACLNKLFELINN